MRVNADKLTDADWKIFSAIKNGTLTIEQFDEYEESLVSNHGNGDAGLALLFEIWQILL
ncbi:MAG: hypothetical protein UV70_C0005G0061 [Parcubacteria group bacterium GW2011_GWA2_43_13]|nr:MAG: hypothetical protein UV70_C0005G0061 [Parcubacteria group bacterium GW2011_GWA2_43_13]HLC95038.1 hypothetical protein [Patescibacteria group bacterium]